MFKLYSNNKKKFIFIIFLILLFFISTFITIFSMNYFSKFNSIEKDFYNVKNDINYGDYSDNNSKIDNGYQYDTKSMNNCYQIDGVNTDSKGGFFSNYSNNGGTIPFSSKVNGTKSFISDLFLKTKNNLLKIKNNLELIKMERSNEYKNLKYISNFNIYSHFLPKLKNITDDFTNNHSNDYFGAFNNLYKNINDIIKTYVLPIQDEFINGSFNDGSLENFLIGKFYFQNPKNINLDNFIVTFYNRFILYTINLYLLEILLAPIEVFNDYHKQGLHVKRFSIFRTNIKDYLKTKSKLILLYSLYNYSSYFFSVFSLMNGINMLLNNRMYQYYFNYTKSNVKNINVMEIIINLFFGSFNKFITTTFQQKNSLYGFSGIDKINNFRKYTTNELSDKIKNPIFLSKINKEQFFTSANIFGNFFNQISLIFYAKNNCLNELNTIFSFSSNKKNANLMWFY